MNKGALPTRKKSEFQRARELLRSHTDAERSLWMHLRNRQLAGARFHRHQSLGPFVADFCCLDRKLVIELDRSGPPSKARFHEARTAFLNRFGYRVLRFGDHEVLQDTEAVLQQIAAVLTATTSTVSRGHGR